MTGATPALSREGGTTLTRKIRSAFLGMALAAVVGGATSLAAAAASPAASPGYGFPTVAQDPTAPITVWVDAGRSAIAAAFQQDHPECPLNVETNDGGAGGSGTFQPRSRSSTRRAKAGPTLCGLGR